PARRRRGHRGRARARWFPPRFSPWFPPRLVRRLRLLSPILLSAVALVRSRLRLPVLRQLLLAVLLPPLLLVLRVRAAGLLHAVRLLRPGVLLSRHPE